MNNGICALCKKNEAAVENFNEVDFFKYYSTDPTSGEEIGPLCGTCFHGLGDTWPNLVPAHGSPVVDKPSECVSVIRLVDPRSLPNEPPAEANCSLDEKGVNQEAVKVLEEILAHFRTGRAVALTMMAYYQSPGPGSDGHIGSYRFNWKLPPGVNAYGISGATHQLARQVDDYLFNNGA